MQQSQFLRFVSRCVAFALHLTLIGCVRESDTVPAPPPEQVAESQAVAQATAAEQGNPAGEGAAASPPPTSPAIREAGATPPETLGTLPEGVGIAAGATVPDALLKNTDGEDVSLASLWGAGPSMVIFYRGGWCPYCNFQIRELVASHAEFARRGVQLVAISVDTVDAASASRAAHEIPFLVLSDPDLAAHAAFGVALQLDASEVERLRGFGIDVEAASGRTHHTIAVPSAFVIDPTGTVRWAHANEDYRQRPSVAQLLGAWDGLRSSLE